MIEVKLGLVAIKRSLKNEDKIIVTIRENEKENNFSSFFRSLYCPSDIEYMECNMK